MKLFNILAFTVSFSPIENNNYPLCKNCNNIIMDNLTCKLYGNLNVVTGQINNLSCDIIRQNTSMCGLEGKFYSRYIPFTHHKLQ